MKNHLLSQHSSFFPEHQREGVQGFYSLPEHLHPALPISVLKQQRKIGWLTLEYPIMEFIIEDLLFLLEQNKEWAGVSRDHLMKRARVPASPLRSFLHAIDDTLQGMHTEGWIQLIPKKDGQLIIYLTQQLIEALPK